MCADHTTLRNNAHADVFYVEQVCAPLANYPLQVNEAAHETAREIALHHFYNDEYLDALIHTCDRFVSAPTRFDQSAAIFNAGNLLARLAQQAATPDPVEGDASSAAVRASVRQRIDDNLGLQIQRATPQLSLQEGMSVVSESILFGVLQNNPHDADIRYSTGKHYEMLLSRMADANSPEIQAERERMLAIIREQALVLANQPQISRDQSLVGIQLRSAALFLAIEDAAGAEESIQNARMLVPNDAEEVLVHNYLGQVMELRGEEDLAIAAFMQSCRLSGYDREECGSAGYALLYADTFDPAATSEFLDQMTLVDVSDLGVADAVMLGKLAARSERWVDSARYAKLAVQKVRVTFESVCSQAIALTPHNSAANAAPHGAAVEAALDGLVDAVSLHEEVAKHLPTVEPLGPLPMAAFSSIPGGPQAGVNTQGLQSIVKQFEEYRHASKFVESRDEAWPRYKSVALLLSDILACDVNNPEVKRVLAATLLDMSASTTEAHQAKEERVGRKEDYIQRAIALLGDVVEVRGGVEKLSIEEYRLYQFAYGELAELYVDDKSKDPDLRKHLDFAKGLTAKSMEHPERKNDPELRSQDGWFHYTEAKYTKQYRLAYDRFVEIDAWMTMLEQTNPAQYDTRTHAQIKLGKLWSAREEAHALLESNKRKKISPTDEYRLAELIGSKTLRDDEAFVEAELSGWRMRRESVYIRVRNPYLGIRALTDDRVSVAALDYGKNAETRIPTSRHRSGSDDDLCTYLSEVPRSRLAEMLGSAELAEKAVVENREKIERLIVGADLGEQHKERLLHTRAWSALHGGDFFRAEAHFNSALTLMKDRTEGVRGQGDGWNPASWFYSDLRKGLMMTLQIQVCERDLVEAVACEKVQRVSSLIEEIAKDPGQSVFKKGKASLKAARENAKRMADHMCD